MLLLSDTQKRIFGGFLTADLESKRTQLRQVKKLIIIALNTSIG